jgi:hypothetical protein
MIFFGESSNSVSQKSLLFLQRSNFKETTKPDDTERKFLGCWPLASVLIFTPKQHKTLAANPWQEVEESYLSGARRYYRLISR